MHTTCYLFGYYVTLYNVCTRLIIMKTLVIYVYKDGNTLNNYMLANSGLLYVHT